jgi:glycine dehydrogenase subunit 1
MSYQPHTAADRRAMLETIGVASVDELFADIPASIANPSLNLPPPLAELELTRLMQQRAAQNEGARLTCFLGAGAYDHFVPAVVDELAGRGEFYTAYTPYQAEISQGLLQSIYEYQSMICALTGLEVSNASMYEAATATWEAILMAERAVRDSTQVVIDGSLNPRYRAVLQSYARSMGLSIVELPPRAGGLDFDAAAERVQKGTSALVVQNPNFFGVVDDYTRAAEIAHAAGALFIMVVNPVSLGLLKTPGEMGADLCVGEGQPLGIPLQFGGPYVGFIATTMKHIRGLPGRLIGATTDARGERGFVMTLRAREQDIRRERASSNICTNQALMALRATIHLTLLGPEGLRELAELNLRKAHYLRTRLADLDGFHLPFDRPTFNEFVVAGPTDADTILKHLRSEGILGGLAMGPYYEGMENCFLVCCTEQRTREEMDRFVEVLGN